MSIIHFDIFFYSEHVKDLMDSQTKDDRTHFSSLASTCKGQFKTKKKKKSRIT